MESTKLFVGNLRFSVREKDLSDLFTPYGKVISTKIIKKKGFGFVEMANKTEAENAQMALDNTIFKNRTIKVDEAHEHAFDRV